MAKQGAKVQVRAIGENTVLAQRYTLTRKLAGQSAPSDGQGASSAEPVDRRGSASAEPVDRRGSASPYQEQWIATDATLGRDVTVTVFPADSARAEAALDSARRAAGVEDHHLPRVLDVGSEDGTAYVISEALHGAESIAAMLQFDPLPAEEVRRLVGESASGLGAAAARGLHHLQLTPHDIVCSPGGAVSVLGLPTDAALAGTEEMSSEEASREDTVALVRIVYAGLTGQWPGDDHVPGLPNVARRADGELPAPSELVPGVPGDLNTLCRTTLGADEGPHTPGELARQLAPWSSERVTTSSHRTTGAPGGPGVTLQAVPGGSAEVDDVAPSDAASSDAAEDPVGDATVPVPRKAALPRSSAAPPPMPESDETAQISSALLMQARERTSAPPVSLDDDYDPSFSDLESPVPGLDGHFDPDHKSSRLALLIVVLLVIVAVVFAAIGLRGIGGSSGPAKSAAASGSATASGTASDSASKTSSADETPVAAPLTVTLTKIWGIPTQNPGLTRNATDDDPKSDWHSFEFGSANGNNNGTGLLLSVGKVTSIGSVVITTIGGPSTIEVFVSDTAESVLHRSPETTITGSGTQTAKLQGVQAKYITLWVTKLSKQSNGKFQERISDVKVYP